MAVLIFDLLQGNGKGGAKGGASLGVPSKSAEESEAALAELLASLDDKKGGGAGKSKGKGKQGGKAPASNDAGAGAAAAGTAGTTAPAVPTKPRDIFLMDPQPVGEANVVMLSAPSSLGELPPRRLIPADVLVDAMSAFAELKPGILARSTVVALLSSAEGAFSSILPLLASLFPR